MKPSKFKRFLCLVLAFCLILPYCVVDIRAAEETVTTISHRQTTGDINYFTFSETGWEGSNANHTWTGDTTSNHESVWYTVDFVGHAIDIYAGKNWPMGYVAYYIDGEYVGEFDLYQSYNSDSLLITRIKGLTDSTHTFKAVATGKNSTGGRNYIDCAKAIFYHAPYLAKSITMADSAITLAEGASHQLSYTSAPAMLC